jgi:hypothetical protein
MADILTIPDDPALTPSAIEINEIALAVRLIWVG